jgi:hypothetical protein
VCDVNTKSISNIPQTLKCMSWNVHGLAKKLNIDFIDFCKQFDVFALLETWARKDSQFCDIFSDYICFQAVRERTSRFGRPHGGIAVYIEKHIADRFTRVKEFWPDCIFFLSDIFGTQEKHIFAFVYVPPCDSNLHNIRECSGIEMLENYLLTLKEEYPDRQLVLMGDFNARTSDKADYIIDDDIDYLPIENDMYVNDTFGIPRCSKDTVLNAYGRQLLQVCSMFDVHFANGRCSPDDAGEYIHS